MIRLPMFTAMTFAILASGPALAGDHCNVPVADWQPREALQQKLETDGWKVRRIKTEDGCYEAYATDAGGKRVEAIYDPKTLQLVKIEKDD